MPSPLSQGPGAHRWYCINTCKIEFIKYKKHIYAYKKFSFLTFYFLKFWLRHKKWKKTFEKFCQDLIIFHYLEKKMQCSERKGGLLTISMMANPLQSLSRTQHRKSNLCLPFVSKRDYKSPGVEIWNYWLKLSLLLLLTGTMKVDRDNIGLAFLKLLWATYPILTHCSF